MKGVRSFYSRFLYIAYSPPPLLFQILSKPLSTTSLSPPTSTPTVLSVDLILWLDVWSRHIWCAILLNDNMDLHKSSLVTWLPKGPWCVFYATKHQIYWRFMHQSISHIMLLFTGTVIWYHKHTKTHNTLGASGLAHPFSCIFTPLFMCSIYYIKLWNKCLNK